MNNTYIIHNDIRVATAVAVQNILIDMNNLNDLRSFNDIILDHAENARLETVMDLDRVYAEGEALSPNMIISQHVYMALNDLVRMTQNAPNANPSEIVQNYYDAMLS